MSDRKEQRHPLLISGTLKNVRVLDLSAHTAGRLASMLIADQGAQVIRVARDVDGHNDGLAALIDRGKQVHHLSVKDFTSANVSALAADADIVFFDDLEVHGLDSIRFDSLRC